MSLAFCKSIDLLERLGKGISYCNLCEKDIKGKPSGHFKTKTHQMLCGCNSCKIYKKLREDNQKTKITCECGGYHNATSRSKSSHKKTKRHQSFISEKVIIKL